MNGADTSRLLKIRRIRLVNFHNFQNETIEIRDNGHLFLLGDNGSGKTTILDAIQYVLTAGNKMEFNSAARMAGSRGEGRRIQGIVMRYNVETGPMNPQGGVAYAAAELADDKGSLLTIGIGISAYSMEERIQRWGIIVPQALEEVPWTVEDEGKLRATSQKEMREALSGGGFYSIGAYEKELARRLFGTYETYTEMCTFLSMGKAYREIAASAADYHELFKTLLPEPKTDLFDKVIETLKTLDEATLLLEEMKKKHEYLKELSFKVKSIFETRESIARYNWLLVHFDIESSALRIDSLNGDLEKTISQTVQLKRKIAQIDQKQLDCGRQLDDLRSKDGAGLLREQKNVREDLAIRENALAAQLSKVEQHNRERSEADSEVKRLQDSLEKTVQLFDRLLDSQIFDNTSLLKEKLAEFRLSTSFRESLEDLPIIPLSKEIESRLVDALRGGDKCKTDRDSVLLKIRDLENQIDILETEEDIKPDLEGWNESCGALSETGVDYTPLYETLEWNTSLSDEDRKVVEEFIGTDILFTLLVSPDNFDSARKTVFADWPGIRIAALENTDRALPYWMSVAFDINRSHPGGLSVLLGEMSGNREPEVKSMDDVRVLSFRSHERRLFCSPSQWIGQEERTRALKTRIALLKEEIREKKAELSKLDKSLESLNALVSAITTFRERLRSAEKDLNTVTNLLMGARQNLRHASERCAAEIEAKTSLESEVSSLKERLETIEGIILREGLEDLEEKIGELTERQSRLSCDYDHTLRELGAREGEMERLKSQIEAVREAICELKRKLEACGDEVIKRVRGQEITDLPHYILRTRQGAQFKSRESVESAIRDSERKESASSATLKEKLNDPTFGSLFGFTYDSETNRLSDRRDQDVEVLALGQEAAVREQQEVINEKTDELFRKIIVNEMMTFFASHLSKLDQMVKTINRHLSRRSFGQSIYKLELEKVDKYKSIIEAVKGFNPFDGKAEDTLKQLIEDHRDEIMNSDVETVPPVLDYRNWYTYQLRMVTADKPGVVMNRHTKSVGSGGEQAVPNYLTILTIAHFLFNGNRIRLHTLLFDEAFYGIDAGRRDQLLGFAGDLGLQLLVASPDQDGGRKEVQQSTTILVVKDREYSIHLYPFHWENQSERQLGLFEETKPATSAQFGEEIGV